MDIKIIINCIIIIFILHIIILNINYTINIGKKRIEKFEALNTENSMKFLTNNNSNSNNEEELKKKLLKYIQQDEPIQKTEFEDKNLNKIQPSNSYLSNNNEPNFESNVADISKFYKINYDNLDENQLKSTSIESLNKKEDKKEIKTEECGDLKFKRESNVNPDNWSYKDELPMNGGNMNGIVGFDSLESQFAIYNPNKLNLQTVSDDKFNNIPHNDLRKPIVYED